MRRRRFGRRSRRRGRRVVAWRGGDACAEAVDWFEEREGERFDGVRSEGD